MEAPKVAREGAHEAVSDRPYIVIANRWAGSGKAHQLAGEVERVIGRAPYAIIEPDLSNAFRQRLNDAVRNAAESVTKSPESVRPLLVCVGGDGTLSLAFDALADSAAAVLAVVPCGSGNDLALTLGLASRDVALAALRDGIVRSIDYGTVNGRRFLNCVGIGLDAEVAGMAARIRERGLARGFSYYLAALRGLLTVKPVGAQVRTPVAEFRYEDLVMLTIGNGRWYGGGFRGAPDALLDDGILDCYVFRDVPGLLARFELMQRIRAGTHAREANVRSLPANQLLVTFDREVAMHIDGEPARCTSAEVALTARGAHVVVPAR